MNIVEGKFYRTRENIKVGPARRQDDASYYNWTVAGNWYTDEGRYVGRDEDHLLDLIAEWTDEPPGPVRSVTRKEIVPGQYGIVRVFARDNEWLPLRVEMPSLGYTADELRAAAATLTEIADALGEAK